MDFQVVIQRNPNGVRVSGKGARSINKRQSPPASPSGSSTNGPATRLERRVEAAQSIRTRDNVAHSRVNHHQLLLGNWNICKILHAYIVNFNLPQRDSNLWNWFIED